MTKPPQTQIRSFINALPVSERHAVEAAAAADSRVEREFLGQFLDVTLKSASHNRSLTTVDLETCRDQGKAAAEANTPLAAVLDLYLSAIWRLWDRLTVANPNGTALVVAAVAGNLFHAADDAAAALADGYQAGQRHAVRSEESARREFVDDLLSGGGTPAFLSEAAARFGFNLAGTHLVAVARTGRSVLDAGPVQTRVERRVVDTFGRRDVVVATKDGSLVCIVPTSNVDLGESLLRVLVESEEGPWRLSLGRPYGGPGGLVRSYGEACESLDLATRMQLSESIVRYESMLPYRILDLDPVTVAEMVRSVLGPLDLARGGALPMIETIEAYFAESLNVTAAARRLHLSPRAVVYRLERIATLTGHSTSNPEGRFTLELAVRARRLLNTTTP